MLGWRLVTSPGFGVALVLMALAPATALAQPDREDSPTPTEQVTLAPAPTTRRDPRALAPEAFNLTVTGGLGLIRLGTPYPLGAGKVAVGGTVMNFDRNPGDVDFFDYGVQFALGLGGRTDVFIRGSPVVRTNSVGQDPVGFPIPPLDLFVDIYPSPASRPGPLFLFAQEVPYKSYNAATEVINPPGHGAFSSSSGAITLGAKVNLLSEDREDPMGLGLRGYVDIPTEEPWYNTPRWGERAGFSGETDIGLDLLAARRFGMTELLVNVGYRHVGDPDRGIRVQFVDSSRTDAAGFLVGPLEEIKLDLHDRLEIGAGASFPAFAIMKQQVWLLSEFGYTRYVGHGTAVERLVHPAEVRLGVQMNIPGYKALSFGTAFQLLLNDGGDGDPRATFLRTPDGRGDINFGENVNAEVSEDVKAFLASRGATFSTNSSKVLSTNNPAFDMWRTIDPAPQRVVSQGGGNILVFLTWRIN